MNAKDIFLAAIDRADPEQRSVFVADACGDDDQLRRRVDALLAAHDDPDSYLARPAAKFDITQSFEGDGKNSSLSDSSSHHGRFLPGTKVADRYRIVSLLGRGGMGEVYRADDLRLGQSVALKFLPEELAKDKKRLDYFHNEVKLARQISHPNVCRVYDIGEVDGQHFISMEYIDGEDLKALLKRIRRLPKDKAAEIAQQLCSALSAAHGKGVLHRDLKPANIMLDGQGHVRITDFGLATIAEDGNDIVGMSGTPAYMAPEQLLRGKTSVQSDIYSLGLVLFELFTGTQVHVADSLAELRRRHEDSSASRSDPGEIVEDLDPATRRGIECCLSPDPADRPSTVEALSMWLPGGDPVAAALAAGETPSPEMVAAAGGDLRLRRSTICSLAAFMVVGMCVVFGLGRNALILERLDEVLGPAVLTHVAHDTLRHLGYESMVADAACGLELPRLLQESVIDEQSVASNGYFDGIWFWFRGSPTTLRSIDSEANGWVTEAHPAWDTVGMTGLRLDLSGKLRWFRAVPAQRPTNVKVGSQPNWSDWFNRDVIGFDLNQLTEVDSTDRPPDAYQHLQGWTGTVQGLGSVQVTAAAIDGRPSFLSVARPVAQGDGPVLIKHSDEPLVAEVTRLCGIALVFAVAYWHYVNGRGDTRSAWTFAALIFTLKLLGWILLAHHSLSVHEITLFWLCLASSLKAGFIGFCGYLAAEPIVRRMWPRALTTWTRLIRGNVRDPRVSEDVLVGMTVGTWMTVLILLMSQYYDVLRGATKDIGGYLGGRFLIGGFLDSSHEAIAACMVGLVMLSFLVQLTRSKVAGIAVWALLLTPFLGSFDGLPVRSWWLRGTLPLLLCAYVYIRHGLVGALSLQLTIFLLILPVTSNTSAYYFESGLIGIVVASVVMLFAIRMALRDQKAVLSPGGLR